MTTICLQAGHQNTQNNCYADMRGSTGAPGEASWTPLIRKRVADLLRAHKFTVVEKDANLNCDPVHPRFDLTLAIHYQADTGHSGFGVFVPDPSLDRDIARSIVLGRSIARVYAERTKLPNYSSPRLGLNTATWENPRTREYYLWRTQNGPLALIECGEGATGAPDSYLLQHLPAKVASAIAEGICVAFGVPFVDPAVAAADAAAAQAAADVAAKTAAAAAAQAAADAAAKAQAADAAAKAQAAQLATEAAAAADKASAAAEHAKAAAAAAAMPLPPEGFWAWLKLFIAWLVHP